MSAIHTGDLRAEGLNGIGTILEFRMEEMPGVHSTAMMACRVDTGKAAGLPGEPVCDRTITIYRVRADRPVYSGMIRRGSVTEENGVQTMRLELVSGTIRRRGPGIRRNPGDWSSGGTGMDRVYSSGGREQP